MLCNWPVVDLLQTCILRQGLNLWQAEAWGRDKARYIGCIVLICIRLCKFSSDSSMPHLVSLTCFVALISWTVKNPWHQTTHFRTMSRLAQQAKGVKPFCCSCMSCRQETQRIQRGRKHFHKCTACTLVFDSGILQKDVASNWRRQIACGMTPLETECTETEPELLGRCS